jgi:hypothetical protein
MHLSSQLLSVSWSSCCSIQFLALATAPYDDEELSDAGRRAIDESIEWFKHNKGIPHEEVLAEFGLTMKDFDKMGQAPAAEKPPSKTKLRRNG